MPAAGSRSPRRLGVLAEHVTVLALLLLVVAHAAPAQAAAVRPGAKAAKVAKVALPKLPAGQPLDQALRALRARGFRAAVVRADGYPAARPGHAFVAAGWVVERRTVVRRKRGGRASVRVRHAAVRPGSRLPRGTRVHVRPRQVRVAPPAALAPAPAGAPSPAAPATPPAAAPPAVTAPPVNLGGTPVIAEPPPGGAAGLPDVVAPPASTTGDAPGDAGTPPPPPPPPPPAPTRPAVDLAAETARFLRDNTLHLPFMDGCTGFLVRDAGGRPIGAVSAAHCGLLPARTPRVTGTDGGLYAVVRGPLEVRRGEDTASAIRIATPETVTLAPSADRTHDLALISFRDTGVSVAGLRAAYQAMALSPTQVRDLPAGRTVTLSAFPKAQPLAGGITRRQVMPATVLGRAPVHTTSGRTIPTIWTAMRANADRAVCSYGASGGAAVTADLDTAADGTTAPRFRLLGVLSGFDDYRPAGENTVGYDGGKVRLEREAQTGFGLDAADATCDYAHELPDAGSAETVRLVTSADQIPR